MAEKLTKGQKTRQRLIESAVKLFGEKGFADTSLQAIADDCQISQTALLQHFGSKNNLLSEVRKFVSEQNHSFVDAAIDDDDDAMTALNKHCSRNLIWAFKNRSQAQIILLTYYYGSFHKEFRASARQALQVGQERIRKYILAAQREGQIQKQVDADKLAAQIHQSLIGSFVRFLACRDRLPQAEIEENQRQNLSQLLH